MYTDKSAIIGNLSVYVTDSNNPNEMKLLWIKSGTQSQSSTDWLQASLDIPVFSSGMRIFFKAQRYLSYMGDIGMSLFVSF